MHKIMSLANSDSAAAATAAFQIGCLLFVCFIFD